MSYYASVGSVEKLDGRITFTQQTPVTGSQVEQFILEVEAELEGILAAQDYVVPVATSATQAYRLVGAYTALGADAKAQAAWPDSPRAESADKAWAAARKMLKDGQVQLPGAERDTDTLQIRANFAAAHGSATPYFLRDMAL